MAELPRNQRFTPAEIAQWLRRHPRFLEQFPDLAATLVVPKEGGASASLAGYQLELLREKNRELQRRLQELVGHANTNERLAVRTHQLSLALMRAKSAGETLRTLVAVLGEDFAGEAVSVLVAGDAPAAIVRQAADATPANAQRGRVVGLDAAAQAAFAGFCQDGEPHCGRLPLALAALLFGEEHAQWASLVLLPVPGLGLVGIGSRDPARFFPGMGTLFLRMMAESMAESMARFSANAPPPETLDR